MMHSNHLQSTNHILSEQLVIKREDLIGNGISGNKFRKLKYNILKAQRLGFSKILTFGGAYSNHILAASFIIYIYEN